ncbi:stromal membrane-associated protein 1-like isoform X2 [Biomphalaria pfeifferi]|uniref:Stromal membrane-associated protein 1-like isoform X2 n=1 Tax=Biomphalaria pfeifferi TaxID=112525 RepID=A0AAD8BDS3_BIOPF|nr:stromal membrane-associated protein 1-like isoform X2 [Biomphalaria pfeifferi]
MSSFKEKEKAKEQQEKFQAILSALLKDEDNKYCVDCDAKGPRWASWNLGIFLCIRCAGIHRNLGVHISKVKSVNLDTWTPEQVSMMQEMGNSRARAVYEANIPDGFRRPQTDSALEAFIRSKYEQKKYIAQEWVPPQPKVPKELVGSSWLDDSKGDKKKVKTKPVATPLPITNLNKLGVSAPSGDSNKVNQPPKPEPVKPLVAKPEPVSSVASNDLLGLDIGYGLPNATKAAAPPPVSGSNELLDLFGGDSGPAQAPNNSDLMNGQMDGSLFGEDQNSGSSDKKATTKDSIMALFGGAPTPQAQMYGIPGGVYMPPQQQMYPGMVNQPQQMMGPNVLMGQTPAMLGPGMGMMGQPANIRHQAMIRPSPVMVNPSPLAQMPMYSSPMMGGNPGMYTPQQIQQLQFQQMQQQMSTLQLNPQTAQSTTGWGKPSSGQTLSTNLWQ